MSMDTITRKISVRMVRNSHIHLRDVTVPEEYGFSASTRSPTRRIFLQPCGRMRHGTPPESKRRLRGSTRVHARARAVGRPVAGFQLVQEKLARMAGNLTASLGTLVRLAQLRDDGVRLERDAALAKGWICDRMRETVALAREVVGGNGIFLDHDVARSSATRRRFLHL